MNDAPTKIANLAKWLSRTSIAVIILSLLGYAYVWTNTKLAYQVVSQNAFPDLPDQLMQWQNILLFIVGAVPSLMFAATLFHAKKFFDSYASGQMFPETSGQKLKSIGRLCLWLAIANPIIRTITLLIMTWLNPPGQKILVISFSSTDGFLLVFSGMLFMIGHILAESNRIAEENKLIV
jgi:Protein of unknown function (DUF2975)